MTKWTTRRRTSTAVTATQTATRHAVESCGGVGSLCIIFVFFFHCFFFWTTRHGWKFAHTVASDAPTPVTLKSLLKSKGFPYNFKWSSFILSRYGSDAKKLSGM